MTTTDAPVGTAEKTRRPGAVVAVLLLVGLAIVLAGVFPFRQLIAQQRLVENTETKLEALIAERGCRAASYTEEQGVTAMAPEDIEIRVVLNRGDADATVWTTDFSYDYVKINAEYRT